MITRSFNFTYTGAAQVFTVQQGGIYKLECWGASGGGNSSRSTGSSGGWGGYAYGEVRLDKGDILYVYVGGAGTYANGTYAGGGYGGGGNGASSGYGGGGASDIRKGATALANRIIVAGGGGGTDDTGSYSGSRYGGNDGSGGNGGGLSGEGAYIDGVLYSAYAGTQTTGYALGQGGSATVMTDTGGGGGGYWGGNVTNNNNGGAGGGSSYIAGLDNAGTTSGVRWGNGAITLTLLFDNYAFFWEKGGKYYLPISKYFDTVNKAFIPVSALDIVNELNYDIGSILMVNIVTPFTIGGVTYNPLDYMNISQYKICVMPCYSNINNVLSNINVGYIPSDTALSKTTIKVKEKFILNDYKLSANDSTFFLDITANDKSKIDYFFDYGEVKSYKNCSILNTDKITNDFYVDFKLNAADSLLQAVTLYGKNNDKYTKLREPNMNVYDDLENNNKFIKFNESHDEVIINDLCRQSLEYTINTLDKF